MGPARIGFLQNRNPNLILPAMRTLNRIRKGQKDLNPVETKTRVLKEKGKKVSYPLDHDIYL